MRGWSRGGKSTSGVANNHCWRSHSDWRAAAGGSHSLKRPAGGEGSGGRIEAVAPFYGARATVLAPRHWRVAGVRAGLAFADGRGHLRLPVADFTCSPPARLASLPTRAAPRQWRVADHQAGFAFTDGRGHLRLPVAAFTCLLPARLAGCLLPLSFARLRQDFPTPSRTKLIPAAPRASILLARHPNGR